MTKKIIALPMPFYRHPTSQIIFIVLLENPNSKAVYPKYDTQYLALNDAPLSTNMYFLNPKATVSLGVKKLSQAKAIIISGAHGHVSERKDLNDCFNTINNIMKESSQKNKDEDNEKQSTKIVGFCFAFQKQLTILKQTINGNLGNFQRYIKKIKISNLDLSLDMFMAHQYYSNSKISTSIDIDVFLTSEDIPILGYHCINNTGLFIQGHPECSLKHVKSTVGELPKNFKKNKYIMLSYIRNFISGSSQEMLKNNLKNALQNNTS